MTYGAAVHHRRSIRLRGHDYAQPGAYFVTVCTQDRRPLLGTVTSGRMALSAVGRMVRECWLDIPRHFSNAALDEWVIMPDHIHGIITLVGANHHSPSPANQRANNDSPRMERANSDSPLRPCGTSGTLGSIIRGFKIGVTRRLGGESPWQRNYYEIIVRTDVALANIRAYIRDNPVNADVLRFGEPRFALGDRALLDLSKTAFLASRDGAATAPALQPRPTCVVSGFLSPMERAVFEACLVVGTPMVWVLARGLPARQPPRIQHALDAGRLLILTPFDETVEVLHRDESVPFRCTENQEVDP